MLIEQRYWKVEARHLRCKSHLATAAGSSQMLKITTVYIKYTDVTLSWRMAWLHYVISKRSTITLCEKEKRGWWQLRHNQNLSTDNSACSWFIATHSSCHTSPLFLWKLKAMTQPVNEFLDVLRFRSILVSAGNDFHNHLRSNRKDTVTPAVEFHVIFLKNLPAEPIHYLPINWSVIKK